MKRRNFIKRTAYASTAIAFIPSFACSSPIKKTGLILYTVRDDMNNNPEGTLDKIAEIGFNWLEAANYANGQFYKMKPSEFRQKVESRGMTLISSHNRLSSENVDEVVNAAAEAGLKYLVMPSLPGSWMESLDGYKEAADFLNMAGEKCKSMGMKVGFHNHSIEFVPIDGQIPYDLMVENTDPDFVTFELDLAWIIAGGQKPEDYFNKYPGRFELLHIKDLSEDKKDATLGEGTIDFVPIFEHVSTAAMKYFFIEQDNCKTHTPIESIEISRNYLLDNVLNK
ncbi:MAG: sugar phosphate isomerase/epimerase [Bacteroidales bacterium]|nr:sugar phosphate isomerase/epimerase [Bacteroidales bacterium]